MEAISAPPDNWQRIVLDQWLAVKPTGKWLHVRNGLSCPRQNGKSWLIEARIIYGAIMLGERILFTAHDYSTVTQLFDRMKEYFGNKANDKEAEYPDLNSLVRMVRRAAGKEAIFFKNGAVIYFSTRTKSSRRGFTVDVVIADECQELTQVQLSSIMSTASSGPLKNSQYIFCGTPPTPASSGDVFAHVRESALDHADDISWNEWSVEQIGDVTDESRWYEVNPALGTRLDIDILRAQLGTMDELGFAQEVLGYWLPVVLAMAVIPAKDWQATTIRREDAPRSGKIALGVKFTPDGKSAAVSAAIIPPGKDAKPYVELLAFREITGGTRWLVGGIMANAKAASVVLIDGKGGSGSLEQALYEAGMPRNAVSVAALTDVQTAESAFLRDVSEHEVTHIKQRWLDDSAAKSVRRNIGNNGAFGFGDGEGSSSAPIESASLALHGARTSRRNPQRKQEARY
jgi:hypothetical protein